MDALHADAGVFSTTFPLPDGLDLAATRIEIVDSLNHAVLTASQHASRRGQQWGLLALTAARMGDLDHARRFWFRSEALHSAAGDEHSSQRAARYVDDPLVAPAFWTETAARARLARPDTGHAGGS